MGNARSIILILNVRQGTVNSDVWYSEKSVFSFMDVLLNILMYLRNILFPRIVISAFKGFILYSCRDLSCLMIWSSF